MLCIRVMRTSLDLSNLGDELEKLAEMLERIEEGREEEEPEEPVTTPLPQ